MKDSVPLDSQEIMQTLVKGVVANSTPAAVKRDGDTTLVMYSLPPLLVALQVENDNVAFVFASCSLKEGLLQVVEADGGVKIETPSKSFPVDPVLHSDIYTTVIQDFKNYSDELAQVATTA